MPISTPCIRVCLLESATGLCEGCGRTGDEIATWGRLSEDERVAIMATLGDRMRAAFLPGADEPQRSAST